MAAIAVQRAIKVYSVGGNQWNSVDQLRPGPDGALWFVTGGMAQGVIGRITTAGVVTTWPIPWPGGSITCFTFGAGFLWSVDQHSVGQSFIGQWTLTGVLVREFPVPETAYAVTWGRDGALWFSGAHLSGMAVSGSYVGRMTLHGMVSQYPLPDASNLAGDIVAGPDGALWFTELPGMRIGRVTTSGDITEYNVPDGVNIGGPIANNQTIVVGSDAELWTIGAGQVATVTTQGAVTVLPSTQPTSITSNADGDLWFLGRASGAEYGAAIRMTPSGSTVAVYPLPSGASVITTGADGMVWFGGQNAIGRLDPSIPPTS